MTDEELIARLRDKNCCESPNCNCDTTADRIEALVKERDAHAEMERIATAALNAVTAERNALRDHVDDLLAEQECGCGYDRPTDVCLGHLPLHRKTVARAEAAEARAERLEAALRFYADEETYETQYERRSCGCCTDIFEPINEDKGAKARAALTQKDRTDD